MFWFRKIGSYKAKEIQRMLKPFTFIFCEWYKENYTTFLFRHAIHQKNK